MKKIFLLSTLFFCLSSAAQVPTAGLLGYYPFNGNANDASGNSQHGTVTGASLTVDRFNVSNSAYSFNGYSDYITLPAGTFTTLNIYSYSCWIKPNSMSVAGFAMCFGESSFGVCQTLAMQATGSITAAGYNVGSNPTQSLIHSSTTFGTNQWLHIAMTRDLSTMKLYVNGVLYSSTSAATNGQNASYGTYTPIRALIGVRSLFNSYFAGSIDEVRIYGNVLSQNDIMALYTDGCFQSNSNSVLPLCSGNSTSIIASPTSTNTIDWYSSLTSTSSIGSGSVYSTPVLSAGVYTYYAASSNCTLAGQRLPITVSVNISPTISVPNGTICSGNSFLISPTGATSYSYSNGNPVSPLSISSYTVVGQNANGCISNTASLTVYVNSTPTLSINSGFVCNGDSFTLTPSGATSYTYSGGSSIVTPTANTSYTITGTNGNGCYATAVSNVGVVATPTLTISNPGNICIGNSANISVSGANYYTWNTGSSSANITVSPSVSTNYTVTGINLYGCISTSVVSLNVNPLPVISVNSGSVCLGNPFTMTPSGASSYTYSSGTNIVTPTVNTTYSVTGTSAQGCVSSNTALANVTVMSLPSISVNSGSICAGASFTMTPTGGISYTYSSGSAIVSPPSNTSYTVSGNGSNGCTNIAVSSVTVVNLPSVSISGPSAICNGMTTTLTAGGASSYTWSTGSNASFISISPGSTVTYSLIGNSSVGCQNTASKLITVNSLPVISVNSGSICSGASFTMIPSGASTYTYSSGSNIVSPSSSTNYSVTGTSAQGCVSSNTAISSVNVVASPVVSVNSGTICSGDSFTLVPSGAISYTYQGGSAVVSPVTTTQYLVTGANSSGCISSVTSTVNVNALPNVSISGSASICFGNSSILTANGANSYTWSTLATSQNISVSPSSTTTYSVLGMDVNGCKSPASLVLTVNPLPVVSVNSGSVCLGNSFTLIPGGASTYTYSSGTNVVSPVTNTSYSVTGTSAQGCVSSNVAVANITVMSLPIVSVNSGSICSGSIFTMVPSGAVTYTYSNGSNTVSPTGNSNYSVTGTNATGCISSPAISSVTVVALPVVSINSGSICNGGTFTLVPGGASTYTISGGSFVVSPTATSSYSLSGTNLAGCISNMAVATVTVNAVPVISVNSGTVCSGQVFTMNPSGAYTYIYSNGSNTVIPTANTSYTVSGTSAQGCASSNQAVSNVTVLALPVISVNSGSICSGSAFTITPSGASTYTYSSGNAVVTPTSNATYSVTGANSQGCVSAAPAISSVNVMAVPSLSISGSSTVCSGSLASYTASGASTYTWNTGSQTANISLTASTNTTLIVLGAGVNGCVSSATQVLNVISTPSLTANNGTICLGNSYIITPSGASTYTISGGSTTVSPLSTTLYTVSGTSAAGCVASNTLNVIVFVNPLPTITVVGTMSVCDGSSTNLTASGASNYTWSAGSFSASVMVTPSVNTTYTVIGSDLNGCINSATAQVLVNPLPTISVSSGAICPGNSFTLNPSGAVTYTYSSGTNIVSPSSTTSYSIIGQNSNGCVSAITAVATVSVVNVLTVTVSGNTLICEGTTASLTANGASTYSWSAGVISNTIALSPSVTTSYTVTGVSGTCSNDAVFSLSVNPSPVITVNSGSVCAGTSFTINPSGASSYTFEGGSAIVTPTTTTNYSVIGSNSYSCASQAVLSNVYVFALPLITGVSSAPVSMCSGEEATLIAVGASNYTWNPGNSVASVLVISPSVTTIFTVTGEDQNNCSSSSVVLQNVDACVGLSETKSQTSISFNVYPNPNNGEFTVNYNLGSSDKGVLILEDVQGKSVFSLNLNSLENTVELRSLNIKEGIYFCRILSNNKTLAVQKFIITE